MQEFTVTSLAQFLRIPIWDTHTMLFRGVANATHSLVPSIGRVKAKDESSREAYEKELLREFERRAIPFLKEVPRTPLEWLFLAQHYGLPTRLLDWSTNPLIALYFACEKHSDKDGAVYKYIQPQWIDVPAAESTPFNMPEGVFGLRPRHTDVRYINQDGVFTIHSRPTHALSHERIEKYVIPSAAKDSLQWQLRKMGFRASFIYPGLDGLARDIAADGTTSLNGGVLRVANDWWEQ